MSKYHVDYMAPQVPCVLANDRVEVVIRDTPIWGVMVTRLVGVASVQLHVGARGDPITRRQGGMIRCTRELLCGLYLSSAAGGAGALAELAIINEPGIAGVGPAFEVVE